MARNPSHARHFRRHYFTLLTLAVFFGLMMVQDAIESAENQADQPLKIQSRAYAGHDHDKDKKIQIADRALNNAAEHAGQHHPQRHETG